MIKLSDFGHRRSIIDVLKFDKFILFGAGDASSETYNYLISKKKKIVAYFDNNKALINKKRNGVNIFSPMMLDKIFKKNTAIIITSSYQYEIASQLINKHNIKLSNLFPYITKMFADHYSSFFIFNNKHLRNLIRMVADPESKDYITRLIAFRWTLDPRFLTPNRNIKSFYNYNLEKLQVKKGDVVIDCGAYIGDTAELYLNQLDKECKIYAIEALPLNFKILKKIIKEKNLNKVIVPIEAAISSRNGTYYLSSNNNLKDPRATLIINKKNETKAIKVLTLDYLFTKLYPTKIDFIKMDIEGAEKDAVYGGKKIIKTYKPKMVIAAYHKPNHIWELPELLHKLNKNYSIYAGHHFKCIYEVEYYLTNN